ncbi:MULTISPECIES: type II-A CRISPR-associated protein Csn2 [Gemella]|uniref:type II-A CRISPR-associated protein Csn2 n=1 Tax=Gemella TaxID=1378 RepID=UPI0007682CAC|nr:MULTISPECIES: type II-A CRISPR-associated protein Csn2 [Gemella]AME09907.1 type II-A CRISPR-associated protein Csn2 [Gemella sp. oral taxon 928]AXI26044.1 type II-A CRISPR-associated protein Csn2 [Gemella sp. ND 6198]
MKIVNREWQRSIELKENIINTIILENKQYFRECVRSLKLQHQGDEGLFIFSDGLKEISLAKYSYLITDLFNLDINNKKILTKIYTELMKYAVENYIELNTIQTNLLNYYENLIHSSSLELEYRDELDIMGMLKLADFKINLISNNDLEKLIKYLKVLVELCGIKVIFIVGLHIYYTENEIKQLYKELCINKIKIINIENQQYKNLSTVDYTEKVYIFDEENCEI